MLYLYRMENVTSLCDDCDGGNHRGHNDVDIEANPQVELGILDKSMLSNFKLLFGPRENVSISLMRFCTELSA